MPITRYRNYIGEAIGRWEILEELDTFGDTPQARYGNRRFRVRHIDLNIEVIRNMASICSTLHYQPANKRRVTEPPARCWIWMRGGLGEESHWKSGWYGAPSVLGGIYMDNPNYRPCRVPEWRVAFKEPEDMKVGPEIPEDAQWMLFPVEPR